MAALRPPGVTVACANEAAVGATEGHEVKGGGREAVTALTRRYASRQCRLGRASVAGAHLGAEGAVHEFLGARLRAPHERGLTTWRVVANLAEQNDANPVYT